MEDKYLSPCATDEMCKGCLLKRSCATKMGIPNCIKQFMDGTKIKKELNDNQQELARLRQQNEKLKEALKPFANIADKEIFRDLKAFYVEPSWFNKNQIDMSKDFVKALQTMKEVCGEEKKG